jgi:hypothetical protein
MRSNTKWCEECQRRAAGFLVPATEDARCMQHWTKKDRKGAFVLARETGAQLEEKETFRQAPISGKRTVIWKPEHRLGVDTDTLGGYHGDPYVHHITVRNRDSSRSHRELICRLPETFELTGPGAEAHAQADAIAVAAVLAKEDLKKRDEVRLAAAAAEAEAFGEQIASVLKTLGIEVKSYAGRYSRFPGDDSPTKPEHMSISMSHKVAAQVAEALGGTIARPPAEPIPLWYVLYDDDRFDQGCYVCARTEAGVIAHMVKHYVHEVREDGNHIPLKPALLIIKTASPDPEVPTEDADEDAA